MKGSRRHHEKVEQSIDRVWEVRGGELGGRRGFPSMRCSCLSRSYL